MSTNRSPSLCRQPASAAARLAGNPISGGDHRAHHACILRVPRIRSWTRQLCHDAHQVRGAFRVAAAYLLRFRSRLGSRAPMGAQVDSPSHATSGPPPVIRSSQSMCRHDRGICSPGSAAPRPPYNFLRVYRTLVGLGPMTMESQSGSGNSSTSSKVKLRSRTDQMVLICR